MSLLTCSGQRCVHWRRRSSRKRSRAPDILENGEQGSSSWPTCCDKRLLSEQLQLVAHSRLFCSVPASVSRRLRSPGCPVDLDVFRPLAHIRPRECSFSSMPHHSSEPSGQYE